jgi:hypothetical protein
MKKNNTLADLLPAKTKKQLLDMRNNYKPIPKIDNKRNLADFGLSKKVFDNNEPKIIKERNQLKAENIKLEAKITILTNLITQAIKDLNHLIEAKEIQDSIKKEIKEGMYSRWKQL